MVCVGPLEMPLVTPQPPPTKLSRVSDATGKEVEAHNIIRIFLKICCVLIMKQNVGYNLPRPLSTHAGWHHIF
jgi:hypothetical protein